MSGSLTVASVEWLGSLLASVAVIGWLGFAVVIAVRLGFSARRVRALIASDSGLLLVGLMWPYVLAKRLLRRVRALLRED